MFRYRLRPPTGLALAARGRHVLSAAAIVPQFVKSLGALSLTMRGRSTLSGPTGVLSYTTTSAPWSAVPNVQFTEGSVTTFDLTPYVPSGMVNPIIDLDPASGPLPAGVTINSALRRLQDAGSGAVSAPNIILRATEQNVAMVDWLARSTAPAVTFASDFSGPTDFVSTATNGGHRHADNNNWVVKDTTDGLTNGCCLRIDSPTNNSTGTHSWIFPLNEAWTSNGQHFGLGVPFWVQFRFKIPASRLVPSNVSGQRGWKILNIAQYSPTNTVGQSFSNTQAEHVLQDTDEFGLLQAYHNPGFAGFYGNPGGQLSLQNAIDRGAGFSGGNRYCWWNNANPTAACERWATDEWLTIMVRIRPSSYSGSANAGNEFDLWYARKDATAWTHLMSHTNYAIGSPNSSGGGFAGINGGTFSTYETNRVSGQVNTHHKYDQVIVSTAAIPLPAVGA